MVSTSDEPTVGRRRLSWRFRVVRASGAPELIEQVTFINVGTAGIERIDLLCSGFEVEKAAPASCEVRVFDAGDLAAAVGASLEVVVTDPAAKEDLAPLVRLLGHAVKSTHKLDDGRLTITVERRI